MLKNIVFEDEQIIVINKPPGIATQTARIGQQDMVSELKNYLAGKPEYKGKGAPFLGVVHRLDQPVSGLLLFARTKQAAAELSRQIAGGQMHKFYYAVIYGTPKTCQGTLENYLYKDARTNQSLLVKEGFPNAKKAVLNYKLIKTLAVLEENMGAENGRDFSRPEEVSLVEISLITGRHHQIRAQMAGADMPLLGDNKYGNQKSKDLSQRTGCRNVALCAYKLVFEHPATKKQVTFVNQPEGEIFLPFFTRGI